MFSPYGLVLTLYRLTEISSRMGLLGCIGYMYNGYAILIALLFISTYSTPTLLLFSVKAYTCSLRKIPKFSLSISG